MTVEVSMSSDTGSIFCLIFSNGQRPILQMGALKSKGDGTSLMAVHIIFG